MTITYEEAVGDYYLAASDAHEFNDHCAWTDASAAYDALTAIRAALADHLGKLYVELHGNGLTKAEIADAIEYATDALAETVEGPVGGLLRDLNAFIRAEAEAKAKRTAEAA